MKRTEHTQKWLDALRSGEYEQGIGQMSHGSKYCCLGVAAHLEGILGRDEDRYVAVTRVMGMTADEMWHCVHMNDGLQGEDRKTFPEIADAIEEMLDE